MEHDLQIHLHDIIESIFEEHRQDLPVVIQVSIGAPITPILRMLIMWAVSGFFLTALIADQGLQVPDLLFQTLEFLLGHHVGLLE